MTLPVRHKFHAQPSWEEGIRFDSKKEAARFKELRLLERSGDVLFFLMQVPFRLPGGTKYVCDFMIFWTDGNVTVEDVKGMRTDMYKMKKKLVEAAYPITITEV